MKPVATRILVRPDILETHAKTAPSRNAEPLEFAVGVQIEPCEWLAAPWIAFMSDGSVVMGDERCE